MTEPATQRPRIAHLALRDRQGFAHFGLAAVAELAGADFCQPVYEPSAVRQYWEEIEALVEHADGFIITGAQVLEPFAKRIKERVSSGARLIVISSVNYIASLNAFLHDFGLSSTPYRILGEDQTSRPVSFLRAPETFVDRDLLKNVHEVTFNIAEVAEFEGDAMPVLIAPDNALVLDRSTDCWADFKPRVPRRVSVEAGVDDTGLPKIASIARWQGTGGQAVVLIGGDLLADLYWTVAGRVAPGIQQNSRFAFNLMRFIAKLDDRPLDPTSAQYYERTEKNLFQFVFLVLRKEYGDDWWERGLSLPARQACVARKEEEPSRRLPKECYLTLIELKGAIRDNWRLFENHFRATGASGGKDRSLAWIDKLIGIRRLIAHPIKTAFSDISTEEQDFVIQMDKRVRTLLAGLPRL